MFQLLCRGSWHSDTLHESPHFLPCPLLDEKLGYQPYQEKSECSCNIKHCLWAHNPPYTKSYFYYTLEDSPSFWKRFRQQNRLRWARPPVGQSQRSANFFGWIRSSFLAGFRMESLSWRSWFGHRALCRSWEQGRWLYPRPLFLFKSLCILWSGPSIW